MARTENYLTNPKLQTFCQQIQAAESVIIEQIWEGPKALLIALAQQHSNKHLVILTHNDHLFDNISYFSDQTPLEFPAWESLPSEEAPPSPDIVGERYRILRLIQESKSPQIILTNFHAILQKLIPPYRLDRLHLILKKGNKVPFDLLPEHLVEMGYHQSSIAADKGEFAVRGGIVDLFPVNSPDPFRIEFWDDEIVSIRKYNPISQTSISKVDEILVTPGEELQLLSQEKELATLFDYLGPNVILIFDKVEELEDKYISLQSLSKKTLGMQRKLFASLEDFPLQPRIYFTANPIEKITHITHLASNQCQFEFFNQQLTAQRWVHPFSPLNQEDPLLYLTDFTHILCLYQTVSEKQSLMNKMQAAGLSGEYMQGYLSSGFTLNEPLLALVPMAELTHRYKLRRQKQRTHYHTDPIETSILNPGEAVVHMNNGIGRYLGIEKRPNHLGIETEYMLIEYAQGGKLYVPMENANLISHYIGPTDAPPELHTLGNSRWQRVRERTQQAIIGYAEDLLKLQAERVIKGGFVYPADSELVIQFGEDFPYQETPDQLLTIQQISHDMQANQSIDRLICGDVGYGKTEIAMRIAFKVVVDGGRQVAILVPTTMLALQHFETFSERMANFPIKIGMLSRFQKPKEIKETLNAVQKGMIDILIGTHRIASSDVNFKNLGLLIIDEEQRFGVRIKEHLKKMRKEVDCLALSATPIPRTLYMSLVGARDLSVINTPPEDRLPIQSMICTHSDELIKHALMREIARNGQAYVIHNRIDSIYKIADRIRQLVPNAKIIVGHGKMSAQQLDTVFHHFKSGNADILVATSIIENGIDIPKANTILIDRADRFGLADLYQMRGRVGRWNRKAYCYFMVPDQKELSEISLKRLSALTEGGNGMKVAMHDLEIRGAGNILGTEQSGHVAAIGFQLYCKLLKKTIASLEKKTSPLFYHEVKIEFPFNARLPENYVNEISLRMEIYQRLGDVEDEEEVDLIIEELHDRFGSPPIEVSWLRCLSRIRIFAAQNHFTFIKLTKSLLVAEQIHGKQKKITKKLIFHYPHQPQEVENMLLAKLKENFPYN
ncbi:MAG: transcription-repair coupling factor [Chlamydiales bacterium]